MLATNLTVVSMSIRVINLSPVTLTPVINYWCEVTTLVKTYCKYQWHWWIIYCWWYNWCKIESILLYKWVVNASLPLLLAVKPLLLSVLTQLLLAHPFLLAALSILLTSAFFHAVLNLPFAIKSLLLSIQPLLIINNLVPFQALFKFIFLLLQYSTVHFFTV